MNIIIALVIGAVIGGIASLVTIHMENVFLQKCAILGEQAKIACENTEKAGQAWEIYESMKYGSPFVGALAMVFATQRN